MYRNSFIKHNILYENTPVLSNQTIFWRTNYYFYTVTLGRGYQMHTFRICQITISYDLPILYR